MNSKVDRYIAENEKWSDKLEAIRTLLLDADLEESFKWSFPVYSFEGKNIISFGAFKNHYGLRFFNGVFLKDKYGLLFDAEESTKMMRQIRFEHDTEIDPKILQIYISEAIENQKNGLEVKPERSKTFEMPAMLASALADQKDLRLAFDKLTFGKQKDYANHISGAKQEKTKLSRLAKIKPLILAGVGLHDKYKNC